MIDDFTVKLINRQNNLWHTLEHCNFRYLRTIDYLYENIVMYRKHSNKNRIKYIFSDGNFTCRYHLSKSRFSQQELQVIDDLFSNLDEDNLAIIKQIIKSKRK